MPVIASFIQLQALGAAVGYMAWVYCVTNFTNPEIVASFLWPHSFTAITTAILAILNQILQAWRIYLFTRNKILFGFLAITSLATCGIGFYAAIGTWIFSEWPEPHALHPAAEANLSLQCAIDVIIAAILTRIYSKSKTAFSSTDTVLNRLIRTAVSSGSFTAVFALGTLFAFRFSPETCMVALFGIPIGRIYTHTILDHLVRRQELRSILNNGNMITLNFTAGSSGSNAVDGNEIMLRATAPDPGSNTGSNGDKNNETFKISSVIRSESGGSHPPRIDNLP
ncbi:hypothetical protein K438DRAFT_1960254 [Mycena galopus ATCC 62051]|nr:hypothetical protein K438DRAFT_1960254 [Mycena galopus ATCC 62051]